MVHNKFYSLLTRCVCLSTDDTLCSSRIRIFFSNSNLFYRTMETMEKHFSKSWTNTVSNADRWTIWARADTRAIILHWRLKINCSTKPMQLTSFLHRNALSSAIVSSFVFFSSFFLHLFCWIQWCVRISIPLHEDELRSERKQVNQRESANNNWTVVYSQSHATSNMHLQRWR